MSATTEASNAAVTAIAEFMAALNARDDAALYDLLHLPHVRISGEGVAIWHDRAELEETYLRDFYARAGPDWHHTTLDLHRGDPQLRAQGPRADPVSPGGTNRIRPSPLTARYGS
ncbi:hypothetical protein GBAR_LOCUS8646 [Geodia barretti]|uniref:SnoaL-like domain-containing protein n=1 Tax=Geodia barretti TaxID=519541 RepID=A0AA35RLD6_GEOBA|nr:hypothetical protein GBAR_LOCUS8646 [Geodia barretti]